MSSFAETAQVMLALEQAIADRRLPSQYSTTGEKLLAQLQSAHQITFVGQEASGKTSLINMMVGYNAMPQLPLGRVIELGFGSELRSFVEYEDGSLLEYEGVVSEPDRPDDVFRVRVERPDDELRSKVYSEIRLSGYDAPTGALLDYVAQSSTLTIWCSEQFELAEQTLWSQLPDHVKDHSFLALTMADRQIMKGLLDANLERLEPFVATQFLDIFPVAVLQGFHARQNTPETSSELWELSGGAQLFDAVHRQLSIGRAEDTDRVRLLLDQLLPPPQVQSEANTSLSNTNVTDNCDVGDTAALSTGETLEKAIQSLIARAESMLHEADELGAFDCKKVLKTCLEIVQDLAEDLASQTQFSTEFEQLIFDMQESENMLLLLQIEENNDAATDAVSLLLQMKKEMSSLVPS